MRVGIIGGSIAGCATAALLHRAGHDVTVFERSESDLVSRGAGIGTPTAVRNALLRQVASPVRWVETIQHMVAMGVRRFVEVGPGSVLTGLIKRIDSTVELINISDVASIEAFLARMRGA